MNGDAVLHTSQPGRAVLATIATGLTAIATMLGAAACDPGPRPGTTGPTAMTPPPADPTMAIATLDPGAVGVKMLSEWTMSKGPTLPGTLYFADGPRDGGAGRLGLAVLKAGTLRRATVEIGAGDRCADNSLSFSPNGHYVSWVPGNPIDGKPAPVVVIEIATGTQTVYDARTGCDTPRWFPDSRRLALRTEHRGVGALDVTTGAFAALPPSYGGATAWAPGGAYRAYSANGEIVVERADGSVVHRFAYDIKCCAGGFSVQRLSADGRRVGVGHVNTDPGQVRVVAKVVDATTGQEVRLPVGEATAGQLPNRDVHFLADGGLILRTPEPAALHVIDTTGQKTATVNQPVPGTLVMVTS
jgi:hypothetical protein